VIHAKSADDSAEINTAMGEWGRGTLGAKRQEVRPGKGGGPSASNRRAMGTASRQTQQPTSTEASAADRRRTGAPCLDELGNARASTIVKVVKRAMAGVHSWDLSSKFFKGGSVV